LLFLSEYQNIGTGAKNVFLISSKATGTIVLQASSSEEKEQWINDFRKEDLIVESLLNIEVVLISFFPNLGSSS